MAAYILMLPVGSIRDPIRRQEQIVWPEHLVVREVGTEAHIASFTFRQKGHYGGPALRYRMLRRKLKYYKSSPELETVPPLERHLITVTSQNGNPTANSKRGT